VIRNGNNPEPLAVLKLTDVSDGICLGVDASDQLLLRRGIKRDERFELWRVPLTDTEMTETCMDVKIPAGMRVSDVALSANRRRLGWILEGPDQHDDPYEIWVSDVSGEGFRRLLLVPPKSELSEDSLSGKVFQMPLSLAWVPGGNLLSFLYRSVLWTLSTGD
jgi:hypothetical protein